MDFNQRKMCAQILTKLFVLVNLIQILFDFDLHVSIPVKKIHTVS
jgi:hypothetical protein